MIPPYIVILVQTRAIASIGTLLSLDHRSYTMHPAMHQACELMIASSQKRVKRMKETDERRMWESRDWRLWKKEEKEKEEREKEEKEKELKEKEDVREANIADRESSFIEEDRDGIFFAPDPLICKVDVGGPDWRSSTKWTRRRASSSNTSSSSENNMSCYGTHFSSPIGSSFKSAI